VEQEDDEEDGKGESVEVEELIEEGDAPEFEELLDASI